MTQLNTTINSYTIDYGIEFNQTYTLNPTITGTATLGTGNALLTTLGAGATAPFWQSSVGPIGGGGSWKLEQRSTSNNTFMRTVPARIPSTWMDGDYSIGLWLMVSDIGPYAFDFPTFRVAPNGSNTPGFAMFASYAGSGATTFSLTTDFLDNTTRTIKTGIPLNTWFYVAFRKTTASSSGEIYYNGELAITGNNPYTSALNQNVGFGSIASDLGDFAVNFSNLYIATNANIDATKIREIWESGSSLTKYWDGSAWQTAIDRKIYNGTDWVDWNNVGLTKQWSGSAWVAI